MVFCTTCSLGEQSLLKGPVSKENYEEFVKEFESKNGSDAYIAISVKDYENLSLNFAELRRYIEQQKEIIVYYEEAVQPAEEESDSQ